MITHANTVQIGILVHSRSTFFPPPFVGTDYYCELGTTSSYDLNEYYFNDPLWDESGCVNSNCCDEPTQPWFYQELTGTTTDDIEATQNSFPSSGRLRSLISLNSIFNKHFLLSQLFIHIHNKYSNTLIV